MSVISGPKAYREPLQEVLTCYSQSFDGITINSDEIEKNKGKWIRDLKRLSEVNTPEELKISEKSEALSAYHTLSKATEFATKLYEQLVSTYEICKRPEISAEAYETIASLEMPAQTILEREKALATVNKHIEYIAGRVFRLLKDPMDRRLPQAAQELDALIKYVDYGLIETRIWGAMKNKMGATPNLNRAYEEWKKTKNPEDLEKQEWMEDLHEEVVSLKPFQNEKAESLDKALAILNLSYIDPETKVRYGVKLPKMPETEIVGQTADRVFESRNLLQKDKVGAIQSQQVADQAASAKGKKK